MCMPAVVAERRQMLGEPHIATLTRYVEGLRSKYPACEFQDFDPLDGGINADLLFLMEKPGPMTSPTGKRKGSGFISRNNDDPTAEALFNFMLQAGIPRTRVVIWNVIPGWNKTIKTTAKEIRQGIDELKMLLILLPKVKTVMLVGGRARLASPLIEQLGLKVLTSAHPSPKVRSINPKLWNAIPLQWQQASNFPIR